MILKVNNWKSVWENKKVLLNEDLLTSLIKADGFDTGFGSYQKESWVSMVLDFSKKVGMGKNKNILEIGCGAGAFVYVLKNNFDCKIYGIDYSNSLLEEARNHIPDGKFYVKEAISIDFMDNFFDVIFAHSVFQYFPNMNYAISTISKSFNQLKSGGSIALLDLNDISYMDEYHKDRSMLYKDKTEYDKAYIGLDHLFFNKEELSNILKNIGFSNIFIYDADSEKCLNSKYRFNVIAKK
jgi:ubiquinone/menaquinone biosynthesis C-methylase UbiE